MKYILHYQIFGGDGRITRRVDAVLIHDEPSLQALLTCGQVSNVRHGPIGGEDGLVHSTGNLQQT